MIDFTQRSVFKLKPMAPDEVMEPIKRFLIEGESIFAAFKTVRDQLVFTNRRIVAANVQGITGKKVDYTSIPYNKVQVFSVETSGALDRDCEIQLHLSSLGQVNFDIKGDFDVVGFNRIISHYVLQV